MARQDYQVLSAVPVMLTADEELDTAANRAVLQNIADAGVTQAFVGGTTAEFTALTDRERITLFELGLEVFGPENTVAHVGATSARQAVRLTRAARELGIGRVAALSPFYHPSVPSRVREYYERVCEAADGSGVYVYTYAELTGVAVSPEFLADLASIPGVIGTKVSAQPLSDFAPLAAAVPEDFQILWGNDGVFDELTVLGGTGTVSGVSSVFPEVFAAWAGALRAGDVAAASELGVRARAAVAAVSCGIGGLKRGLALRGFGTDVTRVPTAQPTDEQAALIAAEVARY